MAFVLLVIANAILVGSTLQVLGSTSTKIGLAPTWQIASTVAAKVRGVVMTSSPGPMSQAFRAKHRASVPEDTPTASFVWQNSANSLSKRATSSPWIKDALASTRPMAASISPFREKY